MIICKCHGCNNRNIGCHAYCDDFRKYKNQIEEKNKKLREDKSQNIFNYEVKRNVKRF